MSTKQQVNVDIITEVKGLQNLAKGQQHLNSFESAAKKLGKTLAGAFAVEKIVQFGKASVEAFAKNEQQVAILNNTLKNLGMSYASISANSFIDHLTLATGKTKEELIPAFQGLLIATGDVTKAQDTLKLAMDVSAGTGKDLQTVQIALSKAYLGNTTSLTRLGAGLDKTLLKTGDMKKITAQLAATFSGDAAIAADTFAGKLARINASATEAKVTIGSGLVDALTLLAGSTSVDHLQESMASLALDTADVIRGVGVLINQLKKLPGAGVLGNLVGNSLLAQTLGALKSLGAKSRTTGGGNGQVGPTADLIALQKSIPIQTKLTATEIARQKAAQATAKAKADSLAKDRAALSLSLAGSTADMQNIEIQAALQRGQTEQVNNVLLLQRALITGNADEANILAQKVLTANGLVMDVNGNITALAGAKDPFKDWPTAAQSAIDQLKKVNDYLATIKDKTITITVNTVTTSSGGSSSGGGGGGGAGNGKPFGPANPIDPGTPFPVITVPIVPNIPAGGQGAGASGGFSAIVAAAMGQVDLNPTGASSTTEYNKEKYGNAGAAPIVINISAPPSTTVTTTQDASTNGTPVTVNRNNPFGMYSV